MMIRACFILMILVIVIQVGSHQKMTALSGRMTVTKTSV